PPNGARSCRNTRAGTSPTVSPFTRTCTRRGRARSSSSIAQPWMQNASQRSTNPLSLIGVIAPELGSVRWSARPPQIFLHVAVLAPCPPGQLAAVLGVVKVHRVAVAWGVMRHETAAGSARVRVGAATVSQVCRPDQDVALAREEARRRELTLLGATAQVFVVRAELRVSRRLPLVAAVEEELREAVRALVVLELAAPGCHVLECDPARHQLHRRADAYEGGVLVHRLLGAAVEGQALVREGRPIEDQLEEALDRGSEDHTPRRLQVLVDVD